MALGITIKNLPTLGRRTQTITRSLQANFIVCMNDQSHDVLCWKFKVFQPLDRRVLQECPMLEKMPAWFGSLLRNVRAGHSKLTIVDETIGIVAGISAGTNIELSSPAFHNHGEIPARFTADGEGISPPLFWGELPKGTASLALIVEDADAPMPKPLVHALLWDIPTDQFGLAEGAMSGNDAVHRGIEIGRNSFMARGWLPPDPPAGHGSHDYVFQLFALAEAPTLNEKPGRSEVIEAMRGHVLGAGMLVGTYSRDRAEVKKDPDPAGSPAPA